MDGLMKYDLIIIGSGILGTSHAYQAAKSGKKVLILEKDNYPVGSTIQNFGQAVASGCVGEWFDYGRKTQEIIGQIQQEFDISARQNGSIYVASDDDEWTLCNELYNIQIQKGYDVKLLSKRQVLEFYPEFNDWYVRGALYYPTELSLEPNLLIYRLLDYIQKKLGVEFRNNSAVIDCEESSGGVVVTTADRQKFGAKKVILCSGYVFNLLYPEIYSDSGLVVSKLQMMQTIPMKNLDFKGNILTGLTIRRYESFEECPSFEKITTPEHYSELKKWGIHILFKQAIDGSIIIGDSHEYAPAIHINDLGFDSKDYLNELMIKEAERIVNFKIRGKIARTWAGFYAQHPDGIFRHNVSKNIHICTGIGGKGMTTSLGFAEDSLKKLY
jgi:D-hydroxyproline dehydrogenase subunit beta